MTRTKPPLKRHKSKKESVSKNKKCELTPKQKLFITEYLIDFNGARAARAAGYSPNGACVTACNLLTNIKIRKAIENKVGKLFEERTELVNKIINEAAAIALIDIEHFSDVEGNLKPLDEIDSRAVQGIKTTRKFDREGNELSVSREFKLHDKLKALDLLGRFLELGNNIELTGKGGGKIELVISPDFIPDSNLDDTTTE